MLKKCQVVMLPTNQQSKIFLKSSNRLEYNQYPPLHGIKDLGWKYQHLYIISDATDKSDEIKEGDWFINIKQNIIYQNDIKNYDTNKAYLKKIIATTDESLKWEFKGVQMSRMFSLPQPSQSFIERFIESYNNGKPIVDILVEYEKEYNNSMEEMLEKEHYQPIGTFDSKNKPKINPKDNTITIKRVKDSYSREETISLIIKGVYDLYDITEIDTDTLLRGLNKTKLEKWIEQNL